jgi:hypothetical protein
MEGRTDLFYFLMANNHFILNESFCFYLTVFFLLALPNSVHPKILTRFYSIYFKIPHKISAQSDGRIENYARQRKTGQIIIFHQISEFLKKL